MELDDEVKYVLKEVQTEIKEEFNEDFSIQEIHDIVHSQISITLFAFKKGVEVRLPFFGSFIRKYKYEKMNLLKKLKEYKEIATPEEYKAKKQRINEYNIRMSKIRKEKRRGSTISTDDFLKLPNLVKVTDKYKDL